MPCFPHLIYIIKYLAPHFIILKEIYLSVFYVKVDTPQITFHLGTFLREIKVKYIKVGEGDYIVYTIYTYTFIYIYISILYYIYPHLLLLLKKIQTSPIYILLIKYTKVGGKSSKYV